MRAEEKRETAGNLAELSLPGMIMENVGVARVKVNLPPPGKKFFPLSHNALREKEGTFSRKFFFLSLSFSFLMNVRPLLRGR